jgi:iron complex outermembrane receptor protein
MMGALQAMLWTAPLSAQQAAGTIRGRVTDELTQEPLSRVTVLIGGRGALTQEDGRYVITGVPAGADTLRARMIGYAPASRPVTVAAGQTLEVDFALTAQAIGLAEIVVTGYGEQRAGDITGAVTQISASDFNTGRIVSPSELIQNKAAGVQVVENNEPGGGTSIRIRGATSVNASSEPLYVIDGLPISTGAGGGLSAGRDPLNFLNPADIENVTVLRDASAAGIYGANAANGVVLIQTRSGRRGPQFSYSTSVSASGVTRLPSMMNAAQFRQAVLQYGDSAQQAQLLNANTNWFDLVTQTAYGQEHNFAVSGAGESMNYRLSLGYLDQEGVVRGTSAERVSLGLNYEQRLFEDRLNLRTNLRGSRTLDEFTPGGVLSNAAQMGPTQPVSDTTTVTGYYDWPGNQLTSADNPVAILGLASDRGTTYRSIGNLQAEYRVPLVQGLRANLNLGYDVTKAERVSFNPSVLHSELKTGNGGTFFRRTPTELNTVFETYVNYLTALSAVPGAVDLTAGYSFSESSADYPWTQATGLSTDLLGTNGVPAAQTVTGRAADVQESRLISFFGRLNYNLGDRYLAALSVRRDGSSRFGPSNAWGTFPSVAMAWRLSEQPGIRSASLSDLKLRATWARTGNQAFANYQQYSTYLVGDALTQVQFGDEFVSTIRPSAVDPNIKWESTNSYNLGLDFGFLNQRVSGAIDWYTKKTDDLIFTVPVAAGTNLSNFVTTNIGSMRNRGIELSLSARLRDGGARGLGWTADFTVSNNSNELVSINPVFGDSIRLQRILTGGVSGGVGTLIQVLQPGEPINSFYVYEHRRGPDGRPVYAEGPGADTLMYVDQNGDGIINVDDRRPFHDPAPKWILTHSSYFSYGRWDLRFTLRSYLGNYVYNNVASQMGAYDEVTRGSPYNLHTSVLETGFETPQYLSDYYVEDASFLRMDNVTVGYLFNYRGRPARVFASVQNAFTVTGYSGVDPTAGLNGLDNNIYPRSRTFTTGLSVQF